MTETTIQQNLQQEALAKLLDKIKIVKEEHMAKTTKTQTTKAQTSIIPKKPVAKKGRPAGSKNAPKEETIEGDFIPVEIWYYFK